MKIRIYVNPSRARRWHVLLAERLIGVGHEVAFAFAEGGLLSPRSVSTLSSFERFLYRKPGDYASKLISFDRFSGLTSDMPEPEIIIDLTASKIGQDNEGTPATVSGLKPITLRLLFDGSPDVSAAIAAILDGHAPKLHVTTQSGRIVFEGLPAVERDQLLSSGLGFIFMRAITIIVRAVTNLETSQPLLGQADTRSVALEKISSFRLLRFAGRVFARKLRAKFNRLLNRAEHENQDHWRIAWRRVFFPDSFVVDELQWAKTGWQKLPDDNRRFYADPFIVERDGMIYVFCEEFPYDDLKGIISVFTIAPDGTASKPRQVLERPFHLSYPFVFEHGGETWMIPETFSSGKIELYRAEHFPDRWVFEQVLVDNVVASDPTLFEKDGLLWLFIADHDHGSSWDTLSLWYADNLKGPWRPHKLNPVLVDARSARPGGKIVVRNGKIIRPAQNCNGYYGRGLVLKEVTRLDIEGYAEHEIADLPPAPEWDMVGVHTLNSGASIEVIDQLGARAKPG